MTRTPSPADLLARHAPSHTYIDDGLDKILDRVMQPSSTRRRLPLPGARRLALAGGLAAAGVAAAVLLPAGLQSSDSGAAALDRLAVTAGTRPATVIPDGSYLHLVTVENPEGVPEAVPPDQRGEPGTYPRTLESWTAPDGTTWRHDRTAAGHEEWFQFAPTVPLGGAPGTSPQELAALPRDDQALLDLLRPVVTGSSSNDEAVFVFLGDALRSGAAPPETQRAMIAAMARLPHIETERTQGHAGRPCLAVRYLEPERPRVVQSVCFDETTAALVEEETFVDGELHFRSVVVERGVVPKVPAEVRRNAPRPQKDR